MPPGPCYLTDLNCKPRNTVYLFAYLTQTSAYMWQDILSQITSKLFSYIVLHTSCCHWWFIFVINSCSMLLSQELIYMHILVCGVQYNVRILQFCVTIKFNSAAILFSCNVENHVWLFCRIVRSFHQREIVCMSSLSCYIKFLLIVWFVTIFRHCYYF